MIESLVIFLVFSKKYIQTEAMIAKNIAVNSHDICKIIPTIIHKKLALAIVCHI